ncbi:hypothetical protein WMF30_10800 [Sorangium sp. So ce134]
MEKREWPVERARAKLLRIAADLIGDGFYEAEAQTLINEAMGVNHGRGYADEQGFRGILSAVLSWGDEEIGPAVAEVYGEPTPVPPKTGEKMGLWRKNGIAGGKYLIARRDGTVPEWPSFVLGAKDPAAEEALRAYAREAEKLGFDARFVADVSVLADEFMNYRVEYGEGDPDGAPHRKDDPATVARMLAGANG